MNLFGAVDQFEWPGADAFDWPFGTITWAPDRIRLRSRHARAQPVKGCVWA